MAVRTPTEFNTLFEHQQYVGNKVILAAGLDGTLDDMEYLLAAEQMVVADHFVPLKTTQGTFQIARYLNMPLKDIADEGVATTVSSLWTVKAWVTGGAGEVRLQEMNGAGAPISDTVTISSATPAWITLRSQSYDTNDTKLSFQLAHRVTTGTTIFLAGLGIFALET